MSSLTTLALFFIGIVIVCIFLILLTLRGSKREDPNIYIIGGCIVLIIVVLPIIIGLLGVL